MVVNQLVVTPLSVLLLLLMKPLNPLAKEFVIFCAKRCGNHWPAIYDEMCYVAGSRMFRDMGYSELIGAGLSLALDDIDITGELVDKALDELPVNVLPSSM